ncbi:hypothetical protein GQ53DRAFT_522314 [Thozetella sp. PMI_491]|nr:hypothetical protein GQ53DRAFT_522314 [Thozetella sp. PMI_491]
MEVVAVVASLTGIIAFAGQAAEGLATLKSLINDIKQGQHGLSEVLQEIEDFENVLEELPALLTSLTACADAAADQHLAASIDRLGDDVLACVGEIETWKNDLSPALSTVPRSKKGLRWFKTISQFRLSKDKAVEMRTKLLARKIGLQLRLSVTAR